MGWTGFARRDFGSIAGFSLGFSGLDGLLGSGFRDCEFDSDGATDDYQILGMSGALAAGIATVFSLSIEIICLFLKSRIPV